MGIAQVGLEPTASLVLSQGGLPIAYRAMFLWIAQGGIRTRNHSGLSRAAQPVGVPGRSIVSDPEWTRTIVVWV